MNFEFYICIFGVSIVAVVTIIAIGILLFDLIKTIAKWIRKN